MIFQRAIIDYERWAAIRACTSVVCALLALFSAWRPASPGRTSTAAATDHWCGARARHESPVPGFFGAVQEAGYELR